MAQWPTSVATDANLYVAVNTLFSFLSAGVGAADTTIPVTSTANFPLVGIVLIDNELVLYTSIAGNSLVNCTRGFDGTVATTHAVGAQASFCIPAAHHNVLKEEIKAIEAYLFPIGNYVASSIPSSSPVNLATSNTFYDITSISLPAGEWDISGIAIINHNSAVTDGQLAELSLSAFASPTATDIALGDNTAAIRLPVGGSSATITLVVPSWRVVLSVPTTIYIKAFTGFSSGTASAYGRISARRVR